MVDVCTANNSHFEIAMAAIAAGKHVYCEKPLATRADHARQMADAARKKGLITLVGFNYIQNPVHALAVSTLRNGDVGEVKHARVFFKSDYMADPDMPHSWRNEKDRAGGGVIGDVVLSLPQLLLSFGRRDDRRGLLQPQRLLSMIGRLGALTAQSDMTPANMTPDAFRIQPMT